jgi:hypothetical protein
LGEQVWRFLCVAGLLMVLSGCATVETPWRGDLPLPSEAVRDCAQHFEALNAAVRRAGVGDAEAHRLAGFPYLRVDRFSASLRDAAAASDTAHAQWLSRLQALDQAARHVEIGNLPDAGIRALQAGSGDRAALLATSARCADLLREQDQPSPARTALIRTLAQVPDHYVMWQRVAGLYGVSRIPFSKGIAQWQRETMLDFQRTAATREVTHPLMRYAVAGAPAVDRAAIANLLRRASDNPLRIPHFSDADTLALVHAYAPVFEVETGADYDRMGRLRWGAAAAPEVDIESPVVYHRIAFTRYGDVTLTQIVYTVWFSQRPHDHALDILAGRLDGVVIRVTLGPQGDPLIYDSIHPCGCYHMFFPAARVQALPAPAGAGEWAFVPATLPAHSAGTRIAVRIATRTHYVTGVALDAVGAAHTYALLPEDDLRRLPVAGGSRSAYAPDGLVPGTQRSERFIFWPMGIPSAGAMRQWGRHATAFVGRRHFDDADLLEKRFRLIAP